MPFCRLFLESIVANSTLVFYRARVQDAPEEMERN